MKRITLRAVLVAYFAVMIISVSAVHFGAGHLPDALILTAAAPLFPLLYVSEMILQHFFLTPAVQDFPIFFLIYPIYFLLLFSPLIAVAMRNRHRTMKRAGANLIQTISS